MKYDDFKNYLKYLYFQIDSMNINLYLSKRFQFFLRLILDKYIKLI